MTSVNIKNVFRILAALIFLLSLTMLIPIAYSTYQIFFEHYNTVVSFEVIRALMYSMLLGMLMSLMVWLFTRKARPIFGRREALFLVSLSWFLGAALAALPFWWWAQTHIFLPHEDTEFLSFISCYFEAMSGLTTTGSTVLSNIESIPKSLLLWRAFTHWLGGLGIVVIFVALLPSLGGANKRLFSAEATGIANEGATPHVKKTSRGLLHIYLGFTFAQIIIMKLVDFNLSWFDSITHTFASLATGGYSTLNASAGGLSIGVQWVIIIFMLLAGVNFGLYQQLLAGKFKQVFKNSELRFYLLLIGLGSLIIFISIQGLNYDITTGEIAPHTIPQQARDSIFQVISIQTTTGFATANFEQWGLIAKSVLIGLMFIGGCGGSTSGGVKVIRALSTLKIMIVELEKSFRPQVIRPIKIAGHSVTNEQRLSVIAYVLGIGILFAFGSVLLLLTEPNISGVTALTATISAINNVGPGLEAVGAIENYAWFSDLGKIILSLLMAIGRLEVFAVLVIFLPHFWRYE